MALPTVNDLKVHLNMSGTASDGELQDTLDAAIEVVEGFVGPLTAGDVTEVHRNVFSSQIVLRQVPAGDLVQVSARNGLVSTPLEASDFELDAATGILRVVMGSGFYGTYEVTFSAGRTTLPASLRLAILIVAAHLWETQRVPGASRFGGDSPVPAGFAVPNRALELMAPYRTSLGIA